MVRRLLLWYPPAWRERYGEELLAVLEAEAEAGRLSWRARADVARAGLGERLGGVGGDARGGVLLVLRAWAVFVVGGVGFQKVSEHWDSAVPSADRAVPRFAYDLMVGAAAAGTAAVLLGILLVGVPVYRFLRAGGWTQIRRAILRALVASVAAGALLVPFALWAHRLTGAQRNGGDWRYQLAGLALFLCWLAALACWTLAAVETARRLELSRTTLRLETWLAAAVTASMAAMTAATALWWAELAAHAPGFLGAVAPANLLVIGILMLAATTLGATGTARSLRA